MAAVRFTQASLEDIARYEAWRLRRNGAWRPIGDALIEAITKAAERFPSFDAVPMPLLAIDGHGALVKRLLVPVRSKVFRVYVGPGRERDVISVRRVRHPARRTIERR